MIQHSIAMGGGFHLLFSAFHSHVVKIFEDRGSWNVVCDVAQRRIAMGWDLHLLS